MSLQNKDNQKIGFMETFTGDPMYKAYMSRTVLHSARNAVQEDFKSQLTKKEQLKQKQQDIVPEKEFFSSENYAHRLKDPRPNPRMQAQAADHKLWAAKYQQDY